MTGQSLLRTHRAPCALVMAGGTGGHIFPGLAVAQALRAQGWQVHWLGAPASMESRLVPPRGFAFEAITFSGVRGKGVATLALLPLRLLRACWQSLQVLARVRPDVVLGFGGYISLPGGLMAWLRRTPLVLHEQNSVAGAANKVLARLARRVFCAFPQALAGAQHVGNPLRAEFLQQALPEQRFAARCGPLQILVLGGSLGAQALNQIVPQALAQLGAAERPVVVHQSGEQHIEALRNAYAQAGVQAELTPFIDDTASAMARADLVICRAGASTVTEIAAVGAAALFVPFPAAVDDHQTHNARFLADQGAAWLMPQSTLTAQSLAQWLQTCDRPTLSRHAQAAKAMQNLQATAAMVAACQEVLA
jgi:UDP-N-acetylglucosamine--N-acetylmuramyl-(pentapeptide) pyrophosphoryl-undecaprenol N-acetylglucosamine transferase